ncbi:hypothetical protein T492DRAFT_958644 [Pavlovales sp. CCMP2436]|nr:hypothetical protein T492DRAFT_958644 [Pavlovales sp. CCMP2436]
MGKKEKMCAQPTDIFFKKLKEREKAQNKKVRDQQALNTLASKPDELRAEMERLDDVRPRDGFKNPKLEARYTELKSKQAAAEERAVKETEGQKISVDMSRITGRKRAVEGEAAVHADDSARPAAFAPPGAYAEPAAPPGVTAPTQAAPQAAGAFVRDLPSGVVPPPAPPRPAGAVAKPVAAIAAVAATTAQSSTGEPAVAVLTPALPVLRELDREVLHMVPAAVRRRPPPQASRPAPRPAAAAADEDVARVDPSAPPQPAVPAAVAAALPPGPPSRPRPAAAPAQPPPPAAGADYADFMSDMADLGAL